MKYLVPVAKVAAVWLVLMIGQMAGGMIGMLLFHPPAMQMLKDGPFDVNQGMAVINVAMAMVMSLLAGRMRGSFTVRALALFVLYYGVGTAQALIEAVYFNDYLKLADAWLWLIGVSGLVQAIPAAAVAAWLWKGRDGTPNRLAGHVWKVPAISLLYVIVYFAAGAMIAWQGAAVRAYYEQGMHIDPAPLALLQIARGALWAGMAWIGARWLSGGTWQGGVMIGLAFATFMAIQLLLPSSFMPWDVRKFHLMEVFSSNFLFGLAAVAIWRIGAKASQPAEARP